MAFAAGLGGLAVSAELRWVMVRKQMNPASGSCRCGVTNLVGMYRLADPEN
jgi:hypothetical protein